MAHTYTNLLTHALFSTKDRQPIIRPEMKSDLYAYRGGIITNLRGKPVLKVDISGRGHSTAQETWG